MSVVAISAYLSYHTLGFLSWFVKRPSWALLSPPARSRRDWGRLWLVLILAGFWWGLFAAPFNLNLKASTAPIFLSVHFDGDIVGAFFDPATEEISRFGLWFGLLALAPSLPRWVVAGVVSIWFALIHSYHIDMTANFSAFWPFYVLAFGMSFILFAVGFRYGILTAFTFHVVFNTVRVAVSLGLPAPWVWLNWPLSALCFAVIFQQLRRVPVKSVFAAEASSEHAAG